MLKTSHIAIAFTAIFCAACSTGAVPPGGSIEPGGQTTPLVGTTWRLVQIQSMDDAQGITRPEPDRVYTMRLSPEGRAEFQLDCNRGMTAYTHQAGEPGSGALSFSNVAMTRMMCPPGSLDTRIARDMGQVRSYTMRADTLSMSLMADGAIYLWKPAPAAQSAN